MSPRAIVVLVTLVLAAIASWYLSDRHQGTDDGVTASPQIHRGYYLKSARILGTGTNGALLYEIEADNAEQQADQRIEFSDVRIRYSPQSDVPWTINADAATLYPDDQRVLLQGHVLIVSEQGFSGDETEIRTPELALEPEAYVASTDARVQIRIGSRSLTATGMLASLQDNTLELRSNVSGRFIP